MIVDCLFYVIELELVEYFSVIWKNRKLNNYFHYLVLHKEGMSTSLADKKGFWMLSLNCIPLFFQYPVGKNKYSLQ